MKEKMFIEFNGVPGTGKTTICKKLEHVIADENLQGLYLQRELTKIEKSYIRFLKIFIEEIPYGSFQIIWRYFLLFTCLHDKRKRDFRIVMAQARLFIVSNQIVRKSKVDIVITDQFYIQGLLSIFYDRDVTEKEKKVIEELNERYSISFGKKVIVNVDLPVENNRNRILNRGGAGSRLDLIHNDKLDDMLMVQRRVLTQIRGIVFGENIININAQYSAIENAKKIYTECCDVGKFIE